MAYGRLLVTIKILLFSWPKVKDIVMSIAIGRGGAAFNLTVSIVFCSDVQLLAVDFAYFI